MSFGEFETGFILPHGRLSVAATPCRVVHCSTCEADITVWEVPLGGSRVLTRPASVEQVARAN